MAKKTLPIINIDKLYYAVITQDDIEGLTYSKPIYLEGIKKIGMTPTISTGEYRHEGKLVVSNQNLDSVEVSIDITDVATEHLVDLFGYKLAKTGGYIETSKDFAKDIALLFRAVLADGEYRYVVLYKGSLVSGELNYEQSDGSPNYQGKTLTGKFMPTAFNNMVRYTVDSDDVGVAEDIDTKFFENVIVAEVKTEVVKEETV